MDEDGFVAEGVVTSKSPRKKNCKVKDLSRSCKPYRQGQGELVGSKDVR